MCPTVGRTHADMVQVEAGRTHTCGVTLDGAARCWGARACSKLGLGAQLDNPTPAKLDMPSGTEPMARVQAGHATTCAYGLAQTRCWGGNNAHQLPGDEDVAAPMNAGAVRGVGADSVCTVENGTLSCLGDYVFVGLWDGLIERADVGDSGWACASWIGAATTPTLSCMGANDHGQVPSAPSGYQTTPTQVIASGVADFGLGTHRGCALVGETPVDTAVVC